MPNQPDRRITKAMERVDRVQSQLTGTQWRSLETAAIPNVASGIGGVGSFLAMTSDPEWAAALQVSSPSATARRPSWARTMNHPT
jgi:hypothetical protein